MKKLRIVPWDFGWDFGMSGDSPLHDGSPYQGLPVRRESLGFVNRSRTIFCRAVPNPKRHDSQLFHRCVPHLAPDERGVQVVDDMASAAECRTLAGASIVAMQRVDSTAGETLLVASDATVLHHWLHPTCCDTLRSVCHRVQRTVSDAFGETRPLYVAGALLTRLQPPPASSSGYDYTTAHVDKANMASYDYSAVVYLNSKGAWPESVV
jgi:hypothetical protein